jgi:prepilin-type N-terminal cleavage/methylation domain-containing protein
MNRRGFTLIEALVALVLTGLVTAGIAMALRTGLDASQRIQERATTHAEARAALDVLAADLAAAYLSGVNTEETYFSAMPPEQAGTEPFLRLTTLSYRRSRGTAAEAEGVRSDAVQVQYALEPREDGRLRLVRGERWLTETGDGETDIVCDGIASLRLRYLGGSEAGEDGWSADPDENPPLQFYEDEEEPEGAVRELPRVVEITLILAPGPDAAESEKPRAYKTLVQLRGGGVPPFEPQRVPRPQQAGGNRQAEDGGQP